MARAVGPTSQTTVGLRAKRTCKACGAHFDGVPQRHYCDACSTPAARQRRARKTRPVAAIEHPRLAGSVPGGAEWLAEHGIDPEVWEARGVWRYGSADIDRVLTAVTPYIRPTPGKDAAKSIAGRLRWVESILNQSDGLFIPKTPIPGGASIPPQLRPDKAVITDPRKTTHYHGPLEGEWPVFPADAGSAAGKELPRKLVLRGIEAEEHIRAQHDGINVTYVHTHEPPTAKYLFLPGTDQTRIDLHPMALELLPDAERVYFVLEGALKNDAVLSHIRERGLRASVFSVPSVTLWSTQELRALAPRLKGKVVIVVPDADWFHNVAVDMQALLVRSALRRLGIEAYIAAPPVSFFEEWAEKGVDDFLGQTSLYVPTGESFLDLVYVPNGEEPWTDEDRDNPEFQYLEEEAWFGGSLDDLSVRGKEAPDVVLDWLSLLRIDRQRRAKQALEALVLHASESGKHYRSLHRLARIMGIRGRVPERVIDTLEDLRAGDAIIIHGSLELKTKNWNGVKLTDFAERPTIEIPQQFRAVEREVMASDFWQRRAWEAQQRELLREIARQDIVGGFESLLEDA